MIRSIDSQGEHGQVRPGTHRASHQRRAVAESFYRARHGDAAACLRESGPSLYDAGPGHGKVVCNGQGAVKALWGIGRQSREPRWPPGYDRADPAKPPRFGPRQGLFAIHGPRFGPRFFAWFPQHLVLMLVADWRLRVRVPSSSLDDAEALERLLDRIAPVSRMIAFTPPTRTLHLFRKSSYCPFTSPGAVRAAHAAQRSKRDWRWPCRFLVLFTSLEESPRPNNPCRARRYPSDW
jgi:hypothetical protein